MNFLFTEMIIQRLMETYVTYSRSWFGESAVIALQRLLNKRMSIK
jgi:hypothetical protein